jgi:hypothetical protein
MHSWWVRFGVFVLGFLLIVIGFGSLTWLNYTNHLHDSDLVKEGAHALIIAGFLAIVVDWFVKAHFIREVTRDVYHYLVGYDLPVEIKDQIKDLTNIKIVRSRFCIDFRFTRHGKENLKGEVTIDFDVENYSSYKETYRPELAIESADNPTFLSLVVTGASKTYCMNETELAENSFAPESGSQQANGKPISILPRKHEGRCHISWRYSIIVPQTYSDVFAFSYPTRDVCITTEMPQGFTFHVSGAESTGNRWEMKPAKQHIRFRCFPTRL